MRNFVNFVVLITFTWILGIIIGSLPAFGWNKITLENVTFEKCFYMSVVSKSYMFFILGGVIVPSCLALIYIYTAIYYVYRRAVSIFIFRTNSNTTFPSIDFGTRHLHSPKWNDTTSYAPNREITLALTKHIYCCSLRIRNSITWRWLSPFLNCLPICHLLAPIIHHRRIVR